MREDTGMKRRFLWALILIAVVVIILILNAGGQASLSFGFLGNFNSPRPVLYGLLTAMGVAIGILIR